MRDAQGSAEKKVTYPYVINSAKRKPTESRVLINRYKTTTNASDRDTASETASKNWA